MVRLFKGTCLAIRAMHDYRAPVGQPQVSSSNSRPSPNQQLQQEHDDDDDDDERFPQAEGDGDGGYSYGSVNVPLVTRHKVESDSDLVFGGDEEVSRTQHQNGNAEGSKTELVPYAHRDMKPGYVEDRDVLVEKLELVLGTL
jgi:serine/threonine kinase 16